MHSFFARQPIMDVNHRVYGYELLFRNSEDNTFPNVSSCSATKRLILEQFIDGDISRWVEKDKTVFINFPSELIINGYVEVLPKEKFIIEVLEDSKPDAELISSLITLKKSGYSFALDDVDESVMNIWFDYIWLFDYIKVDIRGFKNEHLNVLLNLKSDDCVLLAEKVETELEFDLYLKFGFELFQGFFFEKPKVIKSNKIEYANTEVFEILLEVIKNDSDLYRIEGFFNRNPQLALGLLRYVNILGKTSSPISSIKHALVYLGLNDLKKFILILCSSNLNNKLNYDVYAQVLNKAKFCEEMMGLISVKDKTSAFLCGMLSLSNVYFSRDIKDIINQLPISNIIKDAILEFKGELGLVLNLANLYQDGELDKVEAILNKNRLEIKLIDIIQSYKNAVEWNVQCVDLIF